MHKADIDPVGKSLVCCERCTDGVQWRAVNVVDLNNGVGVANGDGADAAFAQRVRDKILFGFCVGDKRQRGGGEIGTTHIDADAIVVEDLDSNRSALC